VGKLTIKLDQKDGKKDFYLFSDETVVGSSNQCHFPVPTGIKGREKVASRHFRIFRKDKSLWLESIEKDKSNTLVNRRRILGPVELIDGDTIKISELSIEFNLREAC
jgi:pSer/pThr/pTyr-binding forkhead associated (FHA) protein